MTIKWRCPSKNLVAGWFWAITLSELPWTVLPQTTPESWQGHSCCDDSDGQLLETSTSWPQGHVHCSGINFIRNSLGHPGWSTPSLVPDFCTCTFLSTCSVLHLNGIFTERRDRDKRDPPCPGSLPTWLSWSGDSCHRFPSLLPHRCWD